MMCSSDHHRSAVLVEMAGKGREVQAERDCERGDSRFDKPIELHHRVQFFTRFPAEQLELFRYDDRLDVRRLRLPGKKDILLGAIHFFDRRNYNPDVQHSKCSSIRQTLHDAERDARHRQ